MNNLELIDLVYNTNNIPDACKNATRALFVDPKLFVLNNDGLNIFDINLGLEALIKIDDISSSELITDLHYFQPEEKLIFGTGRKFVCVCTRSLAVSFILEQEEFSVAEWNNTDEYIAIIRTNGQIEVKQLHFADESFTDLYSTHIDKDVIGWIPVDIGWGSDDTQFDHSKVRKPKARKANVTGNAADIIEEGYPSRDTKPRLSWKSDSTIFAVNYNVNKTRRIKLYSYQCSLIYIYSDIIGLQPHIAWHPNDSKLATVVITNKQRSFILFGRSTSEKYIFPIQTEYEVDQIKWNKTGQYVALRLHSSENISFISIYSFSNYEWYLKQHLAFSEENPLVDFAFANLPNKFAVYVSTFKEVVTYFFKTTAHYNPTLSYNDVRTVAVINGCSLALTHYHKGAMPLPLYHLMINTRYPTNCIAFHTTKQVIATLDSTNHLSIYEYCDTDYKIKCRIRLYSDSDSEIPLKVRNICWTKYSEITFLVSETCDASKMGRVYFIELSEDFDINAPPKLCNGSFYNYMCLTKDHRGIMFQRADVIAVKTLQGESFEIKQPKVPIYIDSVSIDSKVYVFGLTANHIFMINNIPVQNCISSFIVHNKYLILLTEDNEMIVIKLTSSSIKQVCKSDLNDFHSRPIDSGAQVMFVVPNTSNFIIQNKRGNIDIYTCRKIAIDRVESLIQDNKWYDALKALRFDKVDFNVIVDLDISLFLRNVDIFIEDVKSIELLNEFLVSLDDSNVFTTLYADCGIKPKMLLENKCTAIVKALIDKMSNHNYNVYIKSMAIAEIMKSEPSVKGALEHISYLISDSNHIETNCNLAKSIILSIHTLKPNLKLYNTAVGLYDLNLAVFIASCLCMDPLQYQPFLSRLRQMNSLSMRFAINLYLKKFERGLQYCIRLLNNDDIFEYIVTHNLGRQALPLLKYSNSVLFAKVLDLVASELSNNKAYDEAAALYLSAGLHMDALKPITAGLLWKEAVSLMGKLTLSQQERVDIFSKIINGLIGKGKILDAAHLIESQLNNYETAIQLLVANEEFDVAIEYAEKHGRRDIIENTVKDAMDAYFEMIAVKVDQLRDAFTKYKKRLVILWKHKMETYKYVSMGGASHADEVEEPDDSRSIAGSMISGISLTTTRTGLTLRSSSLHKLERQKDNLREGSEFEDIALIKHLYKCIEEAFEYGPTVRKNMIIAISKGLTLQIVMTVLQDKLLSLQRSMKAAIEEIWTPQMTRVDHTTDENWYIYKNIAQLDVQYRVPPQKLHENWAPSILPCFKY